MSDARKLKRLALNLLPFAVVAIIAAPVWLFCARLWWSWTHALLTKPWVEIFCLGNGCLS